MNVRKTALCITIVAITLIATGCGPRARMGCLATSTPGTQFPDPDKLGRHSYSYNPFETNGILYTCKAGHIDLTHVRLNADNTRYLVNKSRNTLLNNKQRFNFGLSLEVTTHKVKIVYPDNWQQLSQTQKEVIADEVSREIGPYLTFNATLWHEVLTWFGVHFAGIEPEFNSSFSWEDLYSNLLGTELGLKAMFDPNHQSFDTAMTHAIQEELQYLQAQPGQTARKASESVRGQWFTGNFVVTTMRKNMDTGADDGHITPVLVPGICPDAVPDTRPVPTLKKTTAYGFKIIHEIHPREWERGAMFRAASPNEKIKYIITEKHFPTLLAHIKKQAIEKHGYIVD